MNLVGVSLKGEIVKNRNDYQYPSPIGDRSTLDDMAGFLTAEKAFSSKLRLGLEVFKIGPKYSSYASKGENFFFNLARQSPNLSPGTVTNNAIYPLVDDNDDLDQWPDDWREDWDVASRRQFFQSDAGIFPGFDLDADGFPDNNRNRNGIPDYDEPFLMYATDSEEFQWGDDFNNNGLIDAWEDDELPNYPYYKDEQGVHYFVRLLPTEGIELRLGRYDIHQIAGGGENVANYGRLKCERRSRGIWFRLDHETKRVWDDIPNPYYRHELQEEVAELAYNWVRYEDPLEMRNSLVNRGQLTAGWTPRRHLNVETKLRYEINGQRETVFEGNGFQPEDRRSFLGAIGRADYTYRIGDLSVMPRLKVQYRRINRKSLPEPTIEEVFAAPILRLDYHLTERSEIRVGIQGFSLSPHRVVDRVDSDNNVSRQDIIVMWFNRSHFSGYRLGTEVGWEYQVLDYDLKERPDIRFNRFFIRMVTGLESSM